MKVLLKATATDSAKDVQVLLVFIRGSKGITEFPEEIPSPLNIIFYSVPTISSF